MRVVSTVALGLAALRAVPVAAQECSLSSDTCGYRGDGECDAGKSCAATTDCFDCDPCRAHLTCATCAAVTGCNWCGKETYCASVAAAPSVLALSGKVSTCAVADFVTTCPSPAPESPILDAQGWVYDAVKVQAVWDQGITGAGVHIVVNDDGVDNTLDEFKSKFDTAASCAEFKPGDGEKHGTTSAAIAAASTAGSCAPGIAAGATVSACRIIGADHADMVDSNFISMHLDKVDVSSNSWGIDACKAKATQGTSSACPFKASATGSPCTAAACTGHNWGNAPEGNCLLALIGYCNSDAGLEEDKAKCMEVLDLWVDCKYNTLSDEVMANLEKGVAQGRSGKGVVYVFAAGNEYAQGEVVNHEGWLNTRLTITVGALGKKLKAASYSTSGAALFISAPGGDREFITNYITAQPAGGCYDAGFGTSYAAPVVSGVVALMLEKRPELTWRDVQGVLAQTAQRVDVLDPSWSRNGAQIFHSYRHGFGLVDAAASVAAAADWELWGAEQMELKESSSLSVNIPDDATSVTSRLSMPALSGKTRFVESVVVYLSVTHPSRGDLHVVLTSPSGTESILTPGHRPESHQPGADETWKLMTVRNWGESGTGEWKLTVKDVSPGNVNECVDLAGWSTVVSGTELVCSAFKEGKFCEEGAVPGSGWDSDWGNIIDVTENTAGVNAKDACCICGGGKNAANVASVLKGWRLMVYSHHIVNPIPSPQNPLPPTPSPPTPLTTARPATANPAAPVVRPSLMFTKPVGHNVSSTVELTVNQDIAVFNRQTFAVSLLVALGASGVSDPNLGTAVFNERAGSVIVDVAFFDRTGNSLDATELNRLAADLCRNADGGGNVTTRAALQAAGVTSGSCPWLPPDVSDDDDGMSGGLLAFIIILLLCIFIGIPISIWIYCTRIKKKDDDALDTMSPEERFSLYKQVAAALEKQYGTVDDAVEQARVAAPDEKNPELVSTDKVREVMGVAGVGEKADAFLSTLCVEDGHVAAADLLGALHGTTLPTTEPQWGHLKKVFARAGGADGTAQCGKLAIALSQDPTAMEFCDAGCTNTKWGDAVLMGIRKRGHDDAITWGDFEEVCKMEMTKQRPTENPLVDADETRQAQAFNVGDEGEAMFQGSWFPARVVECIAPGALPDLPDGGYRVVWLEDNTETLVRSFEMRPPGNVPPTPVAAENPPPAPEAPAAEEPRKAEPTPGAGVYDVGQQVLCFWENDWFPGTVCAVNEADGTYNIDWGNETGDYDVAPDRLKPIEQ
eukprot:TRINITY_DN11567_c0_g1_i1.p1 TRINITY_DN11567_c0_g1~~TRINITY_DN11567_c0_g1_i1.p1  ORF type:complete len:1253 (+),score=298.80 TRINITY_DN11567_c0_g1_i1:66-3824(+)